MDEHMKHTTIKKRLTLSTLALSFPLLFSAQASQALNIALTNDDGWDAAGIQTLKKALVEAGHTVTLAGSSENQSGSSAAINLGTYNLRITKQADNDGDTGANEYSVALADGSGAEPATAGQVAIAIAQQSGEPVDLLISGTNAGGNVGALTNLSGTVGAVVHALSYTNGVSVPAIAFSTDEVIPERYCPDGKEDSCAYVNYKHFKKVANWMVGFVEELESKPGWLGYEDQLLPKGVALNINYPTNIISGYDEEGDPEYSYLDEITGVTLNVQGKLPSLGGLPIALPIGCYSDCVNAEVGSVSYGGITGKPLIDNVNEKYHADTTAYAQGNVTIVPIDVSLTANPFQRLKFKKLVRELNAQ
jgi:5'/3'-nucleotidase SurE